MDVLSSIYKIKCMPDKLYNISLLQSVQKYMDKRGLKLLVFSLSLSCFPYYKVFKAKGKLQMDFWKMKASNDLMMSTNTTIY
jgi:hypothetical protein